MKASAPGKLILFGEYAVLEGQTALVAAVDRYAVSEWSPADSLRVSAPEVGLYDPAENLYALPFIEAAVKEAPTLTGYFTVDTGSFRDDGSKLGLGSSAAATVAFTATMHRALGLRFDTEGIFVAAHNAHRTVQGVGSGADIAASVFGGIVEYAWQPTTSPVTDAIDIVTRDGFARIGSVSDGPQTLLTVWTGHSASTTQLVGHVNRLKQKKAQLYDRLMIQIADAARLASQAWSRSDRSELIRCAVATTDALLELGQLSGTALVTKSHRDLIDCVGDDGFVKPTGAGGGDLAWVIGHTPEDEARIEDRLRQTGYRCLRLQVAKSGVSEQS